MLFFRSICLFAFSLISVYVYGDVSGFFEQFAKEVLLKNSDSEYPVELWSGRGKSKLDIYDIAQQIKELEANKNEWLASLQPEKKDKLEARLEQMVDVADRVLRMKEDKWKAPYVDELNKHIINLRQLGISDKLPKRLDSRLCPEDYGIVYLCDDEGRLFGNLRKSDPFDKTSIEDNVEQYMQAHNTSLDVIKHWVSAQGGSSTSAASMAVKRFYQDNRELSNEGYWWPKIWEKIIIQDEWSKAEYQNASIDHHPSYGLTDKHLVCPHYTTIKIFDEKNTASDNEERHKKAFTIWHAYIQEILRKVQFFNNQQKTKILKVIRAEGKDVLISNGIKIGDFQNNIFFPRAVYDSTSLLMPPWTLMMLEEAVEQIPEDQKISYKTHLQQTPCVEFNGPHHRVIHIYFLTNNLREDQNEVVMLTSGDLPCDYTMNADISLNEYQKRYLKPDLMLEDSSNNLLFTEKLLLNKETWTIFASKRHFNIDGKTYTLMLKNAFPIVTAYNEHYKSQWGNRIYLGNASKRTQLVLQSSQDEIIIPLELSEELPLEHNFTIKKDGSVLNVEVKLYGLWSYREPLISVDISIEAAPLEEKSTWTPIFSNECGNPLFTTTLVLKLLLEKGIVQKMNGVQFELKPAQSTRDEEAIHYAINDQPLVLLVDGEEIIELPKVSLSAIMKTPLEKSFQLKGETYNINLSIVRGEKKSGTMNYCLSWKISQAVNAIH